MLIRRMSALLCAILGAFACASVLPLFSPGAIQASGGTLYPYGDCAAPSKQGFNLCNPGTSETSSPFQVIAAATSGTGQVQTMEVYADGKKVAAASGSPFDEPISLGTGNHSITVVEQDSTGTELKTTPFKLTVEETVPFDCSAPSGPGVKVCSPLPNGCNTQPWVEFQAAGKGKSGSVSRMELWVAGTKIANFSGDKINTSLIMAFGEIKVVEVDSKGNSLSDSFFYTGPC